jgi:hypothetical protein
MRCLWGLQKHGARFGKAGKENSRGATTSGCSRPTATSGQGRVGRDEVGSTTLSALAIPQSKDPLGQLVQDGGIEEWTTEAEVANQDPQENRSTTRHDGVDRRHLGRRGPSFRQGRKSMEADIKGPE